MLILRKKQLEAFDRIERPAFIDQMMVHIRKHFPRHPEFLGQATMRAVVDNGIVQAEKYSFVTRHDVCLFVDLMIMLGHGFDTDPQLPWAIDILKDETLPTPAEKMDLLYDSAMDYLDKVVGKDEAFPVRPLKALRDFPFAALGQKNSAGFDRTLLDTFQKIWPQKYRLLKKDSLSMVIRNGTDAAKKLGFTANPGRGMVVMLMYVLGHGFYDDPQYILLSKPLNDRKISEENVKFDRFQEVLKTTLSNILAE